MSTYGQIAERFDELVRKVPPEAWTAPAPCEGWTARDIVRHLVEWVPAVIGRAGIEFSPAPPVDTDAVAAWSALHRTLTESLASPHVSGRTFDAGPPGQLSVAQAIEMLVVGDLFIHTWDLARAAGLDASLDEQYAEAMLTGLQPIEELLRSSGHYGPKVAAPANASVIDQLVAFTGRDPNWQAPR